MNRIIFWTVVSVFLIPAILFAGEETYFWDKMELDFYSRIDKGRHVLKKKLVNVRLKEAWNTIESVFRAAYCPLTESRLAEFSDSSITPDEIESIAGGDLTPLNKKLKNSTSDNVAYYYNCLQKYYETTKDAIGKNIKNMEEVASIGLFSDGSKENSEYDIVDDLRILNEIIFVSKIEYPNKPNTAGSAASKLIRWWAWAARLPGYIPANALATLLWWHNDIPPDDIDTSWGNEDSTPSDSSWEETSSTTTSWWASNTTLLSSNLACPVDPASSSILNPSLISDINGLLQWDGSFDSTIGWRDDVPWLYSDDENNVNSDWTSNPSSNPSAHQDKSGSSDDDDNYLCGEFFCIKITTKMDSWRGGSKWASSSASTKESFTIEGIMNQHGKILDEHMGKNMDAQCTQKTNFGLNFADMLDLVKKAHIGVHVNYLPAPLMKGSTSRPANQESDQKEEVDKILSNTARQNGFPWAEKLDDTLLYTSTFIDPCLSLQMKNANDTGRTDEAAKKLREICDLEGNRSWDYSTQKIDSVQKEYYDSLWVDFNEIKFYTDTIINNIREIAGSIKQFPSKQSN